MWPSHTFLTASDIKLYVTAAMRTAVSTHVAEILRDAGLKVTPHILSGTPNMTLCFLRVYTYGKSRSRREFILGSLVCINLKNLKMIE